MFISNYSLIDTIGSSARRLLADPTFPAAINLTALDGINGFAVKGISANDHSGWSVSIAGDVNGDGFNDVIIGAYLVSSG